MTLNRLEKSFARKAVEAVLTTASRPLAAEEVAELAGIHVTLARTHLGNAVNKGRAHNINPKSRGHGRYVWGAAGVPKLPAVITSRIPTAEYDGRELRPFTARQGAMDAYRLSSNVNGELVPACRPIIMSSSVGASKGEGR